MQLFKALGLSNHPWWLFWFLPSWCSPNLLTLAKTLPLKGRTYLLPHSAFSLSIHSAVRGSYDLQSACPNRSKNYKLQFLDSATLHLWRTAVPHFKYVQNWAITHWVLWWKALKTWLFSFLLFPTTARFSPLLSILLHCLLYSAKLKPVRRKDWLQDFWEEGAAQTHLHELPISLWWVLFAVMNQHLIQQFHIVIYFLQCVHAFCHFLNPSLILQGVKQRHKKWVSL